jgi:syntaxin 1B/2/3
LQNAVSDIEERYRDILKLENVLSLLIQSVNQVHKLFLEMAALVSLQGELIDNIEANVKTAKAHVFEAEVDIKKSKENLISARKVT